jgi:hypothetical protein
MQLMPARSAASAPQNGHESAEEHDLAAVLREK